MLAMSPAKAAPAVRFEATLYAIDGSAVLRLPEKAGSVGECDPGSRHAPAQRGSQQLEDAEREAPTVLIQPGRVHRPGPSKNGKLIDPR
jgi:hypothetical protein